LEHKENNNRYEEAYDCRKEKFCLLFMLFDCCAKVFMESYLRLLYGFLFERFFSIGIPLYSMVKDADEDNRYEVDGSQSEKITLTPQYSDNQWL
jgi:hypothetical protein